MQVKNPNGSLRPPEEFNEKTAKKLEKELMKGTAKSAEIFLGTKKNINERQKKYEENKKKLEAVRNQKIRKYHIGRNDPCICGSKKKYKKCLFIIIN